MSENHEQNSNSEDTILGPEEFSLRVEPAAQPFRAVFEDLSYDDFRLFIAIFIA